MKLPQLLVPACVAFGLVSCSSEPYKIAPISGRVTLDGKPVAKWAVMLQPVASGKSINPGPGSAGVTDEDGRYTLTVIGKTTKGAVIGKHQVRFTPFDDSSDSSDDYPKKRSKPAVQV